MKRQIKFRGYSKEAEGYVYGFFHQMEVENTITSYIIHQGISIEVVTESVSQYTGMNDRKGAEIYEGDTIKLIATYSIDIDVEWDQYQDMYLGDNFYTGYDFNNGIASNSIVIQTDFSKFAL